MSAISEQVSILLGIIAGLVVLVNIIVEVLKPFTQKSINTNWVALIVSMVLTLCAGGAYASVMKISVEWYMVMAVVVVGFMVAYAAMFGFDKLKQALGGAK